jgi:mannitol/fructose-specific phosphotransferase system IIA component (Ntr-type)
VRNPRKSMAGSRTVMFELSSPEVADLVIAKLVAEFRNEGFFTSLLSKEYSVWAVPMDDMEVSDSRQNNKIKIECTPAEEAMVMTAWMEVASEMNDLARQISKPIRSEDVDQMLKKADVSSCGRSGVSRYLRGFVMIPRFKASGKQEAFERIVAEIAQLNPNHVSDVKAATEAVLHREESMPTGLDNGIAVPHGRHSSVTGIAGAVAIVEGEEGISDYETIDASAVKIIVLTLANDKAQTPYLQLMAYISKKLRANDGYRQLAQCSTAEEMRRFFRSAK